MSFKNCESSRVCHRWITRDYLFSVSFTTIQSVRIQSVRSMSRIKSVRFMSVSFTRIQSARFIFRLFKI